MSDSKNKLISARLEDYLEAFYEINVEKKMFINIFTNVENKEGINYISSQIENFNSDFDKLKSFVLKNRLLLLF